MKRFSFFMVCLVLVGQLFAKGQVQKLDNGMKINPDGGTAKTIVISVVNHKVIHESQVH